MRRIGRLALFAAVVSTGAPIVVFAVGLALAPQPTDFMCFWAGSDLLARGADPYDPGTWAAAVDGLFPNWLGLLRRPPCPGGYAYPLTTAVATLPLGVLPVRLAALVWMVLLLGGMAVGIVLIARGFGLGQRGGLLLAAITLGSQPAWLTALTSQYGGLDLLALGILTLRGAAVRPALSAGALTVLLLKPHI
ncbi:MAG TPA: glycosyltransferase 87 family protein, partial [Candidatus Saccharimonadales bacterium]|nr:glycosyltransferase 87 family protein [Candidatus Saccharimonadales bacterium]